MHLNDATRHKIEEEESAFCFSAELGSRREERHLTNKYNVCVYSNICCFLEINVFDRVTHLVFNIKLSPN